MPVPSHYVLDTSVVAKFFLDEVDSDKARALLQQSINGQVVLKCPYLVFYELTNTFIIQEMALADVHSCLVKFQGFVDNDVIIIESPTMKLLKKTAEIASTDTQGQGYISSYDAAFHALALLESIVLLTADKKHVRKTRSLFGSVEELSEFSTSEPE